MFIHFTFLQMDEYWTMKDLEDKQAGIDRIMENTYHFHSKKFHHDEKKD
jgi:hypothetical protein